MQPRPLPVDDRRDREQRTARTKCQGGRMAAAAARGPRRRAHDFVTTACRFARTPLRPGAGSAAVNGEASAWRRRTVMTSCTLIAVAALAAVWSTPALTHGPSTTAALRATAPKPAP